MIWVSSAINRAARLSKRDFSSSLVTILSQCPHNQQQLPPIGTGLV